MRVLVACLVAYAVATRDSESTSHGELKVDEPRTCRDRVKLVVDGPWKSWFKKKIHKLMFDDPFAMIGVKEEDLVNSMSKSMLFHCKFFRLKKSCDGIRNARLDKAGEFPAKISPEDPNCFEKQFAQLAGPAKQRCEIVRCYRALLEKNCQDVLASKGPLNIDLQKSCPK